MNSESEFNLATLFKNETEIEFKPTPIRPDAFKPKPYHYAKDLEQEVDWKPPTKIERSSNLFGYTLTKEGLTLVDFGAENTLGSGFVWDAYYDGESLIETAQSKLNLTYDNFGKNHIHVSYKVNPWTGLYNYHEKIFNMRSKRIQIIDSSNMTIPRARNRSKAFENDTFSR